MSKLKTLVGPYHLYHSEGNAYDNDPNFVQEEYMKKLVVENFGRYRESLFEALRCEDYEASIKLRPQRVWEEKKSTLRVVNSHYHDHAPQPIPFKEPMSEISYIGKILKKWPRKAKKCCFSPFWPPKTYLYFMQLQKNWCAHGSACI